ncbi:MAG: DUF3820 family protein [Candidatus Scalindua rubra]
MLSDKEYLLKLAKARMPSGRYKDMLLLDLPEWYILVSDMFSLTS